MTHVCELLSLGARARCGLGFEGRNDAGLLGVGRAGAVDAGVAEVDGDVLDALERVQGVLGIEIDVGGVESVLDDAHERVGEHAGLHVPSNAGFAGVEQRPQLERGLERAEGVLDAP